MKNNDKEKNVLNIKNKEISFKYEIIEKYECGIELKGTESKSIRAGKCNLKDSFALLVGREIILKNMHIAEYEFGNINNVPTKRDRRLLLHKNEILKISNFVKQGGYALVPSRVYMSGRWIKVELCVCKGKKLYDKRQDIIKREENRKLNEFKRQ